MASLVWDSIWILSSPLTASLFWSPSLFDHHQYASLRHPQYPCWSPTKFPKVESGTCERVSGRNIISERRHWTRLWKQCDIISWSWPKKCLCRLGNWHLVGQPRLSYVSTYTCIYCWSRPDNSKLSLNWCLSNTQTRTGENASMIFLWSWSPKQLSTSLMVGNLVEKSSLGIPIQYILVRQPLIEILDTQVSI